MKNKIQKIFQKFFKEAKKTYNFSVEQIKVAECIMKCRTGAYGERVSICDSCNQEVIHYNSCGNRHCPTCQTIKKEKWIDDRRADLIDAPYFHIVFTLPQVLKMLIYQNKEVLYSLMFKSVAKTLNILAIDPKNLGAQIGHISILHTWSKSLDFHPHIHTIVLGGGLTKDNVWKQSQKEFFIHVNKISKMFRGIFIKHLKLLYNQNKLNFYGELKLLEDPSVFKSLIDKCYEKPWYTYCKETFNGPENVIKYLGRYTHRIAISNARIERYTDKTVTFKFKGKTITLSGVEFIRRFLMHILPSGFVKIRHHGLLGNVNKKTKLELCKKLTNSKTYRKKYMDKSSVEILLDIFGSNIFKCSYCEDGKLITLNELRSKFKNTA